MNLYLVLFFTFANVWAVEQCSQTEWNEFSEVCGQYRNPEACSSSNVTSCTWCTFDSCLSFAHQDRNKEGYEYVPWCWYSPPKACIFSVSPKACHGTILHLNYSTLEQCPIQVMSTPLKAPAITMIVIGSLFLMGFIIAALEHFYQIRQNQKLLHKQKVFMLN